MAKRIELTDVLQRDLRQCQEDLELQQNARPESQAVVVEQLKQDNERLLAMLRETKEYRDFAGFVEDSGGNVVSKPSVKAAANIVEEWLPDEAFRVAHQFREQHGNDLTPALINQLLGDLNKIWREREKRQISRIKQQCAEQIAVLKR